MSVFGTLSDAEHSPGAAGPVPVVANHFTIYPRKEIPPVPANLDGNPRSKELPWKGLPAR